MQKYLFTLTCTSPGWVYGLGGAELHGMLFSMLQDMDPEKAGKLHESVDKPFSFSPLWGPGEREKEIFRFTEGNEYYFYLSCLDDEMCQVGEFLAKRWAGGHVRLGTAAFTGGRVERLFPAGFDYYDLLVMPPLKEEFIFNFRSPTSFRSQGRQILFPLPEKVFQNLQRRWNAFSPVQFLEDTDFSFIMASRYSLRTELVPFGRYKIIGFKGRCSYRLPRKYTGIMAFRMSALARFAEIAGVGYKTSMSMGSVVLEEE